MNVVVSKLPHFWTVAASVVATLSMAISLTLGPADDYEPRDGNTWPTSQPSPPAYARRFGWPQIYMWKAYDSVVLEEEFDSVWEELRMIQSDNRWSFSLSQVYEYYPEWLYFDVIFCAAIVLGSAYCVERFCQNSRNDMRLQITALLALTGWFASLMVTERATN